MERLIDVPQPEIEDAAYQAIMDPSEARMFWEVLGVCCANDPGYEGLYQALAMRANPEFGESMFRVLPPDHPAIYWYAVLPDDCVSATV